MIDRQIYQTPSIHRVGSFEALTQGQGQGLRFDGTFLIGTPVPLDPSENPIIFS